MSVAANYNNRFPCWPRVEFSAKKMDGGDLMSKFVNYKKRSIDLPAGSKNLIDVLKGSEPAQPAPTLHYGKVLQHVPPTVSRSETFSGNIPDIEKYVAMVSESRVFSFLLSISRADDKIVLQVSRREGDILGAGVSVQFDTDLERAVRRFFVHRGLPVPEDSEMPSVFVPNIPVQVIFDISSLPPEVSTLSKFAADLFREALGLTDDSKLTFTIYETKLVE